MCVRERENIYEEEVGTAGRCPAWIREEALPRPDSSPGPLITQPVLPDPGLPQPTVVTSLWCYPCCPDEGPGAAIPKASKEYAKLWK